MQDLFNMMCREQAKTLRTTAYSKDNTVFMDIDAPGFTKDEIELIIENGRFTIKANKTETNHIEGAEYTHCERVVSCERSFRVPSHLTVEDFTAHLENGVLHIEFPISKEVPETNNRINIT